MRLFSDPSDYHKLFDAIIVGTGLTGGWAAKELTEAGLEVLLLDAGPLFPPEAATNLTWWTTARRREASLRQPAQSRHPAWWWSNPQFFVDDRDNPYLTDTDFVWVRGRQVGGRSLTWGGVTLRFSDHEFLAPERDGIGARWPIAYRDLAPYYDVVERFLPIQGNSDGLDQLPDGKYGRPFEMSETEARFKDAIEALWPNRQVISCRGISGDHSDPKRWSARTSLYGTLPAAFATGRATLRPDAVVSHLIARSDGGLVDGVGCIDSVTKQAFEVRGRTVLLCASAIESVRILLNSKDGNHPEGIGNSSGSLGRYLMDHATVTVGGVLSNSRHLPRHSLGGANGICIPKFRNVTEVADRFIRGYGIWGGMQRGTPVSATAAATWFLTAVMEVLPTETNRIRLDAQHVDAWGIPTVRVHLEYGENERQMKKDAIHTILEMSDAAGLDISSMSVTAPGRYVHEVGGARMGDDRRTSVVDPWNSCWDAPNLYVLDGACFASSGWQNPSLTMMALAVRACRTLTSRWASKPLSPEVGNAT